LVHLGFLVVVVLNLVAGFHALGTLLAVGLIMLPAIAARFWTENVGGMIGVATLIGIVSSAAGILVSYHAGLPTGPTIILAAGAIYVLSIIFGARNGLLWPALPRRHLEA
jgi:zinc/manganese transport system permease protein